jgi:hypothetical protein
MHDQASGVRPPRDTDQTQAATHATTPRRPRSSRVSYFGERHPLASVARCRCRSEHPRLTRRLGDIACGPCWEHAIRADERVVVELGLPAVLVADPDLVDEVAVERACRGESVRLTPAERRAAFARLLAEGMTPTQAGERLGMSGSAVSAVLAELAALAEHGEGVAA